MCEFQVGILVTCEDLYSDRQWKICHAFATFVSRRTEAGKVTERGLKQSRAHHRFGGACLSSSGRFGFLCAGTAQAGDSLYTNGADGVQPGSRAAEDATHPC